MFYKVKVKDFVRVPPSMFSLSKKEAILKNIRESYENYVSKEMGFVIGVSEIGEADEGVIVPGDGAGYYEAEFDLITFKPEMNEVVYGRIKDVVDFGAFVELGATEGMVHIGQSMDDFVSFSKDKVLQGKKSGKSIKVGDRCKARIIAVSYRDMNNPKIGLTMRQEGLGKLEWLNQEETNTAKPAEEKVEKKK